VGLGFGAGDGFGFGGGGGGGGGVVATRIAAVPTASPARAVIVAELVPDQVIFVWPLASVRGAVSESSPLEAASVSGTFGAGTLPASVADVAIVSSSEPPPAGKSQLFGVRKTAAATPSALCAGGGAGAVGERRVHPEETTRNNASATFQPRVRPMMRRILHPG